MREITKPGELTRAELERLCAIHLEDGLLALEQLGITVCIVAVPTKDPVDGKCLIFGNTEEQYDMAKVFEDAAKSLRAGAFFELVEGKS